jgi:AAA15 family ATPase/GTPase
MKIHKVTLTNFRGYRNPTAIDFNDLTFFVGRNDIGKSTILEALDLFFNDGKGAIKYDDNDINIASDSHEYSIGVSFVDLPEALVVDSSFQTNLADEYLLNADGELEIIKKYNGKKCTTILLRTNHPTNNLCVDLQLKKKSDLRDLIQQNGIHCDNLNVNSIMRRAIWNHCADNLQLATIDLDITAGDDTKKIWEKLSAFLPVYSLFQSDRQNSDKDTEVQDPLKLAVAQFFQDAELQGTLNTVAMQVEQKLKEVSARTLAKLREMDPHVADSLKPVIPTATPTKWAKVFEGVSMSADEDIPINKRGSGVKRLILLNFFRAEAERRQEDGDSTGIIYAIEEPETSQHFTNQKILTDALVELSKTQNTQVILTTHSGVIVKRLQYDDIRLININSEGDKYISSIQRGLLIYPSLNEVNYTAFDEVTEEYHDELYGFIEGQGWLQKFENGKPQRPYIKEKRNRAGVVIELQNTTRTLTHYIRDVHHHPENNHNEKYTEQELLQSISDMRTFINLELRQTQLTHR